MTIEEAFLRLMASGGWAGVSGLLGILVLIFYKVQFNKLWADIERKDKLLQDNHERVLSSFEENTKAIQNMIVHLGQVFDKTKHIEHKMDAVSGRITEKLDKIYYSINGSDRARTPKKSV